MIASFPDYNLDDLVTKDFLRAELGDLRYETATTMNDVAQKWFLWSIATMITLVSIVCGFIVAVH